MSTPDARHPATARDIIREIIRNMREGLEPLHYTTLPPAIYHVYLHSGRFRAPAGHFPAHAGGNPPGSRRRDGRVESRIAGRTAEAVAEALVESGGARWRLARGFFENTDDDVETGRYCHLFRTGAAVQAGIRRGQHDQANQHAAHVGRD